MVYTLIGSLFPAETQTDRDLQENEETKCLTLQTKPSGQRCLARVNWYFNIKIINIQPFISTKVVLNQI